MLCFRILVKIVVVTAMFLVVAEQCLHRARTFLLLASEGAGGSPGAGRGHGQDR